MKELKMSEAEYLSAINSYEKEACINRSNMTEIAEELHRRYMGAPYGDELEDRSQAVSNDVMDVVDSDMPSHARNFLGAGKICIFDPKSDSPEDIREAEEKTEYIDWIVRRQPDSFRVNHSYLKDIEIQQAGIIKYYMEDIEEKRQVSYEGLTPEETELVLESLRGEDVKKVEMIGRSDALVSEFGVDAGIERFDIDFEVTVEVRRPRIIGVPIGSLLISSDAEDEDSATLVGDEITKTRGELMAMGHSFEVVKGLRSASSLSYNNVDCRYEHHSDMTQGEFDSWSNEDVEIRDLYIKIDKDGDGVSERRHILKSGDVILEDEPFDMVPYAVTSAILMPHSAIGRSRAEITAPTARVNTALIRGLLDNTYGHNAPMVGVNDSVNEDDLLLRRPGGLVRVEGEMPPANAINPILIPYIGQESIQVIQFMDQKRAQTTGTMIASQGLQSDQFEKETATRFNGTKDASMAKIELVTRVIAETGYKRLYNGLAWLVSQYKASATEIMVLGKQMSIDPAGWKFKHEASSQIGLGSGDGKGSTETMAAILSLQQQLKAGGSQLVDEVKIYNTVDGMLKSLDIHNTAKHFNNPERPDQLIVAENEQLKAMLQQMQGVVQQLQSQNPIAEAEMIRAQASLEAAKGKGAVEAHKLKESKRQFNVTAAQKARAQEQDTAIKLTELEIDSQQNIPGSII
jgi:hypothetical protein